MDHGKHLEGGQLDIHLQLQDNDVVLEHHKALLLDMHLVPWHLGKLNVEAGERLLVEVQEDMKDCTLGDMQGCIQEDMQGCSQEGRQDLADLDLATCLCCLITS